MMTLRGVDVPARRHELLTELAPVWWQRLADVADRHPFLVLRAMRQLARAGLAVPLIKPARALLTLANPGLTEHAVRPGGQRATDDILRAVAPAFAAAVRAARESLTSPVTL